MGYLVLGLGNSTIFERKVSRSEEKQKLSLQACREPKEKKLYPRFTQVKIDTHMQISSRWTYPTSCIQPDFSGIIT